MRRRAVLAVIVAAVSIAAASGLRRLADAAPDASAPPAPRPLPRLIDLGAGKCVPCKAMAPILDGLRSEFAGRMEVTFIDVWKDEAAAAAYGVRVIPTQIFFGEDGRELARHEGFLDRAGILARWQALGVTF